MLCLLLSLTVASAVEESLLQLQGPNQLTGVGATRYGTWGAQKFKWDVKSKVSKYFAIETTGHNQTTKGLATLTGSDNSSTSDLTTTTENNTVKSGKAISSHSDTETRALLQTKKDWKATSYTGGKSVYDGDTSDLGKHVVGQGKATSGASVDYENTKSWDATNAAKKSVNDIDLDAYMSLEEDNQKLTDQEVEQPELQQDRDGYVKSNWSSTDKYTTWAAIGILERMIDRATADPYTRGTDATPPPKGMGFSSHPGKVGVFNEGHDASHPEEPADDLKFPAKNGW